MQRTQAIGLLVVTLAVMLSAPASAACNTALLMIDVQDLFLTWHPWITASDEDIVDAVARVLDMARDANVPVIYIQDFSMPNWERFYADRLGFPEAIAPHEDDPIFEKTDGNAFTNEALGEYLSTHRIGHLVFTGLASDGCVEATLFGAMTLGYDVTVVADAHASWKALASASALKNRYWESFGATTVPMNEINWSTLGCAQPAD